MSRHTLEIERDGRCERVDLETRSTLHHDFTHLAVEEAAGIDHGFFGSLASGKSLTELAGGAGESASRRPTDRRRRWPPISMPPSARI